MVDDEHESEDLVKLLRSVGILWVLEERNKDIKLPVVIKPSLLLVDLIDLENRGGLEGSQPVFHQGEELLFHLRGEVLVTDFVVLEEKLFKLTGS